jgi:NAD+ kinase
MANKIAIFGGSFNPPGTHHRLVVESLIPHFDRIIVLPCGPRPDKPTTNDVDPWHRGALTDIAFRGLDKVEVDLSDLECAQFTTNDKFADRYGHLGEIWHVIGSDLSEGGSTGQSAIHRYWELGAEMWNTLNFCVVARAGYSVTEADVPPRGMLVQLDTQSSGASSDIRERIFKRQPYAQFVTPEVLAYIERYGLYRGRIPARRTNWQIGAPRILLVTDTRNPKTAALAEQLRKWEDTENPNCVVVLGGDGTMLWAIREHWRRRVPFLGINHGHLGFLLNEPDMLPPEKMGETDFIVRQMPMLYVETEAPDGTRGNHLAFNDAWLERSTSQSAWIEVSVNDDLRIPKLVADGVLTCTAAGSTAYARSMGVAPLLADTPGWILVGSNVMSPVGWKSALLAPETNVSMRTLGGDKRPLAAFIDGRSAGPVNTFRVRQSRIATVELAFCSKRDMAEKIARIQFPDNAQTLD